MAFRTLQRRRSQLAVLAGACRDGVLASIALRRRDRTVGQVRFVEMQRDGILFAWSEGRVTEIDAPGQPVEVCFEFDDARYAFSALTRGHARPSDAPGAGPLLLKVALPIRVEYAVRREHFRWRLDPAEPCQIKLTHVVDSRREFEARLTDISRGGLAAVAHTGDVGEIGTGDLFWAEFALPSGEDGFEFVVRLIHLRPLRNSDQLVLGWAFQPSDDGAEYDRQFERLDRHLERRRTADGSGVKSDREEDQGC